MIKVEELFIAPTATVLETLRKLDETGQRILFIAPEGHLKAVITDGDIRKFFLRGGTPDQTVDHAANYHPLSVSVSERGKARSILQEHCIDALPVLNKRGVITDIIFAHGLDLDNRKQVDIPVVMMAGGLGTRLYASASSFVAPSLTTLGAPSTTSLASFNPNPVASLTALITLTLLAPTSVNSTSNSVFSSAAPPSAPAAATTTPAAADTPNSSSHAFTKSFNSKTVNPLITSMISAVVIVISSINNSL